MGMNIILAQRSTLFLRQMMDGEAVGGCDQLWSGKVPDDELKKMCRCAKKNRSIVTPLAR